MTPLHMSKHFTLTLRVLYIYIYIHLTCQFGALGSMYALHMCYGIFYDILKVYIMLTTLGSDKEWICSYVGRFLYFCFFACRKPGGGCVFFFVKLLRRIIICLDHSLVHKNFKFYCKQLQGFFNVSMEETCV